MTETLSGFALPSVPLPSTRSGLVDLSRLRGWIVAYCYPRTGRPDEASPPGWETIPGALGCTAQSCAFRDLHAEVQRLGARVYGISTQTTAYQQEAVERLRLPFELLSDARLEFARALRLPTFSVGEMTFLRRCSSGSGTRG